MKNVLLFACVVAIGCGPQVEFSPRYPNKTYGPFDKTASRVYHVASYCDEVGVVRADGTSGELIEAIAQEAADRGGNQYILRDPVETVAYETHGSRWGNTYHARTTRDVHQYRAAVVYRCP